MPYRPALDVLDRRDRRLGGGRQRREALGRRVHGVPVRHPAGLRVRRPRQQPAGLGHGQLRAPELPHLGALDLPAERQDERLHPVTDAEHGDAELQQLRIEPRRARRVDRRRAAAEDQPASARACAPPRRPRDAAAARRTRRAPAPAVRSAANTVRRSRGRRLHRWRRRARARAPRPADQPAARSLPAAVLEVG